MATGKIKVNFKMPTPSAADRMHAKHQIIRKAAGLPDVDNNPDRPDAGKYSSGSSKPVKRVTPVATPSVNESDITVVKKGTGIKKKISDISYGIFKSHGFVKEEEKVEESFRIGGMGSGGRGNIHMYDRNPGPRDDESDHVPYVPKTDKDKKLAAALTDVGKTFPKSITARPKYPKLKEAKDSQEYDYEGDMAKSDLRSIIHNAQTLHDMIDDDTNLAEWCQSKITLAEDYISTVTNYMRSEMKEEVGIDEMIVVKTNKPIGTRVADIGPGGKEYNVKTDKAYDDAKKKQPQGAEFAAQRRKERLAKSGRMDEGRASQRHPLEGHEYHKKSDEALIHIAKDAHTAAEAMKGHNTQAENKYRDQANDSATVRHFRKTSGMPDWYKKKYGHVKEEVEQLDEKKKLPGLWANIHAKRKRGEAPAKPGDKDYPKTLNIEGVQDDPKADQMTTDDTKFPKKSRKASIVKAAAKKMPSEDQFQAKPVLDSQVAQQTNK